MGSEFSGKVAVVTGGASGIGRAIVEKFATEGARVVIADVDRDRGEALAAEVGGAVSFRMTDVSVPEHVSGLIDFAVESFGGCDVMVNNAGVAGTRHWDFLEDDLADFQRVMSINLLGVMQGTRDAARYMAAHGGGSIINISSIGGVQPGPGPMTYTSSKAAVIHFTKSVAIALAQHGIRVNGIAPGHIPTPLLASSMPAGSSEADIEQYITQVRGIMRSMRPLKRDGTGADVAAAVAYFASEESRYVTGTILPVDGGAVAGVLGPPSLNEGAAQTLPTNGTQAVTP